MTTTETSSYVIPLTFAIAVIPLTMVLGSFLWSISGDIYGESVSILLGEKIHLVPRSVQ